MLFFSRFPPEQYHWFPSFWVRKEEKKRKGEDDLSVSPMQFRDKWWEKKERARATKKERSPRGLIIRGYPVVCICSASHRTLLSFSSLLVTAVGMLMADLSNGRLVLPGITCPLLLGLAFVPITTGTNINPRTVTALRETVQSLLRERGRLVLRQISFSHLSEWRPKSRCILLPGELLLPWFVKS